MQSKEVSKLLSMLPQSSNAPEDLTVYDLVKQGRYPYHNIFSFWSKRDEEIVLESIKKVGLINEKENRTIVMVIHDINHALKYADNIVAIKNGNILAQGAKKEVINEELIKEVFDVQCKLIDSPIDDCKLCVPFI